MSRRRRHQNGNSLIEFTMVGIPLMFVIISTFEMSRAMWTYETLAYAAKEGTRYAAVHGENCAVTPNNCAIKVSDIAAVMQNAGIGLDPSLLQVTLSGSLARTVGPKTLNACVQDASYWPVTGASTPGLAADPGEYLEISVTYPFASAISMFLPGSNDAIIFGTKTLAANSRERIEY